MAGRRIMTNFPGKRRIIRDHCKSAPRSVEFDAKGNQGEGQVIKVQRVFKGQRKSQIEGTGRVVHGKHCIILVQANPDRTLKSN